jgi:hypothetical protein
MINSADNGDSNSSPSLSLIEELNTNQTYNRNRNFNNKQDIGLNSSSPSNSSSSSSYQSKTGTIRNINDKWILIQKNTFTNWINEQIKSENEKINDIKRDLADGVKLIKLVNALQQPNSKVSKRFFKKPINQHQSLENMTLALNAITEDGIRLVNIGKNQFISLK